MLRASRPLSKEKGIGIDKEIKIEIEIHERILATEHTCIPGQDQEDVGGC